MRSCSSANTAGSTYAARCTAPSRTRFWGITSERNGETQVAAVLVGVQQVDPLGRDGESGAALPQAPGAAPGEPALLVAAILAEQQVRARRQLCGLRALDGDVGQVVIDSRRGRIERREPVLQAINAHAQERQRLVE